MTRRLRSLLVVMVTVALGVGAAAALLWWQSGEWLRQAVEAELQSRLVPTVRVAGPVGWRLRPRPELTVRDVRLADAAGQPLLRVREIVAVIDVHVETRRVEVISLDLAGVDMTLRRDMEGDWNAGGWLRPTVDEGTPAAPGVPIGRVRVTDARVRFDSDRTGEPSGTFEQLRFEAGPLQPGRAGRVDVASALHLTSPQRASVQVALGGGFEIDAQDLALTAVHLAIEGEAEPWSKLRVAITAGRIGVDTSSGAVAASGLGMEIEVEGAAGSMGAAGTLAQLDASGADWRAAALRADLRAQRNGQILSSHVTAATLMATKERWAVTGLDLEVASDGGVAPLRLNLAGEVESVREGEHAGAGAGVAGLYPPGIVTLHAREAYVELPHPDGASAPLAVPWAGSVRIDPVRARGEGDVRGSFDQSRFAGSWRYDPQAVPPLGVALTLDRLDLDRYLPPPAASADPVDLTLWRTLPVEVDLRVGELRVQGLVSKDARLQLRGAITGAQ